MHDFVILYVLNKNDVDADRPLRSQTHVKRRTLIYHYKTHGKQFHNENRCPPSFFFIFYAYICRCSRAKAIKGAAMQRSPPASRTGCLLARVSLARVTVSSLCRNHVLLLTSRRGPQQPGESRRCNNGRYFSRSLYSSSVPF